MPPLLPTLTGLTAPCSGSSLALSCGGANRQLDGYAGSTIFCLHQAERNAMPILIPDIFKGPMEYLQAEEILRRLFDRIKCEDYQGPMWTQWMTNTPINGTRDRKSTRLNSSH